MLVRVFTHGAQAFTGDLSEHYEMFLKVLLSYYTNIGEVDHVPLESVQHFM